MADTQATPVTTTTETTVTTQTQVVASAAAEKQLTSPPNGLVYASLSRRAVAAILDSILTTVVISIILSATGMGSLTSTSGDSGSPVLLAFVLTILYLVAMEGMHGQTVGKMALKIKVLKEDGSKITYKDALIRNGLLVIDDFFFFLVGYISASKSPMKQRVGDQVAHTIVVNA